MDIIKNMINDGLPTPLLLLLAAIVQFGAICAFA